METVTKLKNNGGIDMKFKSKIKKEKENVSEMTKLIDIPEYKTVQQRTICNKCKHKYSCSMNCTKSTTGAKIYCRKFAKKYYTMQTIIFVIIQALGIWEICSKSFDLYFKIGISLIYTAILFFFDALASRLAKIFSEKIEIERKKKYDKKVSEIKLINEQIECKKTGKTKEYNEFAEKIMLIEKKLNSDAKVIRGMRFDNVEFENHKVANSFDELVKRLESLNKKINPQNYSDNSVQVFYNIHLETFLEKTQNYITLYKEKKLTPNQLVKFEELLQLVIGKIDSYIEFFLKIEEEKFIAELDEFKENIINKGTEGEK